MAHSAKKRLQNRRNYVENKENVLVNRKQILS